MVRYNHRTENNWNTQPMFQEKVESLELSNSIAQDHLKKERLTSWMKNIKKWVVDRDFCIVLLLKLGSFSTASDKIYIWRLEVTTSQDCVSFIFCSPPPLCVQILCLGTKDYLCNNPHASKKYAQLHMCLNVMLAPSTTTAYPKIPKDNCTFVRHRQLCQRAGCEALRIEWAERGNWICELNLLRFLFLFLTNSEGLCDADL